METSDKYILKYLLIIICLGFSQISYTQNIERLSLKDRMHINLILGSNVYLNLDEEINNPINLTGGFEGSVHFPVRGNFNIATGIAYTLERSMINGQYHEVAESKIKFSKVDQVYSENYYLINSLSVPLILRFNMPNPGDNLNQFLGLGFKGSIYTRYFHEYYYNGEKAITDVKPFIPEFMPSIFVSFGQSVWRKDKKSVVNQVEGEIGVDLKSMDDYNLRRIYFLFKIGI
jgi:hypothetical protein